MQLERMQLAVIHHVTRSAAVPTLKASSVLQNDAASRQEKDARSLYLQPEFFFGRYVAVSENIIRRHIS